ncbi:hypothetical protein LAZ67_2004585 [Cordylochernes scorpioides]|uniref:Uncharacterized protein n=1 Tax=Cordylochernes scorpioides TaxID=51811 RepID=A0ABY6K5F7_9ARAC|nr:hypothetical protein LAZ67_2004585 [Cordylochernes scorpioides]
MIIVKIWWEDVETIFYVVWSRDWDPIKRKAQPEEVVRVGRLGERVCRSGERNKELELKKLKRKGTERFIGTQKIRPEAQEERQLRFVGTQKIRPEAQVNRQKRFIGTQRIRPGAQVNRHQRFIGTHRIRPEAQVSSTLEEGKLSQAYPDSSRLIGLRLKLEYSLDAQAVRISRRLQGLEPEENIAMIKQETQTKMGEYHFQPFRNPSIFTGERNQNPEKWLK